MSWLNSSLSHIVRDEEEVELPVYDLRLLNEALINVGSWGWVQDLRSSLFEESLSYSLVNDDKCDLRSFLIVFSLKSVLISTDLFELFKFIVDNLLSH